MSEMRQEVPKRTEIEKLLLERIKLTGPIPFATYMQLCLSHPIHGYYMNPENKVFGAGGDFITSPEISQVFGEFLDTYRNGAPLRIVELGPGKGTLMGDILRVVRKFQPQQLISVHLVETSRAMRGLQNHHLASSDQSNVRLHWHDSINEIPQSASEYTMLVAHEFFDALPVHILQKNKETGQWHEVLIATNEGEKPAVETVKKAEAAMESSQPLNEERQTYKPISEAASTTDPNNPSQRSLSPQKQDSPVLRRVLASQPSSIGLVLGLSSKRFAELPPESFLEVSPAAFRIARKVGELLTTTPTKPIAPIAQAEDDSSMTQADSQNVADLEAEGESKPLGGCGLIIDYGAAKAFSDSLRAFKQHKIVDIFDEPGNCDITANVDFEYLKEAMQDIVTPLGPISQGSFLARMGLGLRLRTLLQSAKTQERQDIIHGAAMRLIDPKKMGGQYQVLGITGYGGHDNQKEGAEKADGGVGLWPFTKDPLGQ